MTRTEHDFLGEKQIPENALYGIHALRAKENFPNSQPFPIEWYKATGIVKQACYQTYQRFALALESQNHQVPFELLPAQTLKALVWAAGQVAQGKHFEHFIVPAWQGGAGTSINLNINEIIANLALQKTGEKPGSYHKIDPIEHANIYQSTNDVIPTALKVAALFLLNDLEEAINTLRAGFEQHERTHRNTLRIAHTQMQQAVPSSYGKLLGAYSEALSRDWWRVSKCFERIKVVNLGGSAVGTGLAVPRFFIMEVVAGLQRLTRLPVTRSENLPDATSNLDALAEVHGILKAHAVNLEKISADLRLLASDLLGRNEVQLPQKQTGSSIMPGKVNPVIPEFVVSVSHRVYSNDQLISALTAQGCLDLNPYLPAIGYALLESLKLLISANQSLSRQLVSQMKIDSQTALQNLYASPAVATALTPYIGYKKAAQIAGEMKNSQSDIFRANEKLGLLPGKSLENILKPENLLKTGFSIKDLRPNGENS